MNDRTRRPVTPAYVFFYLLFSTDTWRLFFGGVLAALAMPHVAPPTLTVAGKVVLTIMLVAIGWALTEDVQLKDGGMRNNQMTNYVIPTAGDLSPIRVHFVEQPTQYGPGGAKGIGELPMDGPAPAVTNAVNDALGASVDALPITPERLMEHTEESNHEQL